MNAIASKWPRVAFASGTLEALKWFALACMVVDHANRILFDYQLGTWAEILGRLAFPIFAVVFGYNLARPRVDAGNISRRCFLWGVIASALYMPALGMWPLNVLFTLAVAAFVVDVQQNRAYLPIGSEPRRYWPLVAITGCFVDYLWPGVCLVLAARWYFREPGPMPALSIAACLLAISLLMGNTWAFLAVPVLLVASYVAVDVPRARWVFLAAYPLHLAILALLARV